MFIYVFILLFSFIILVRKDLLQALSADGIMVNSMQSVLNGL